MNLHNDKRAYFGYDILISGIVTIRFDHMPLISIRLLILRYLPLTSVLRVHTGSILLQVFLDPIV